MSSDPAFAGAGKTIGLEIWRIENFQCVKIPDVVGRFYTGDSYIILATAGQSQWAIHFWIGSKSSVDESGTVSYKAAELDELLGGSPVQYRECEGAESSLFLSYFKDSGGIEYLNGGVDSGFNHVVRDQYTTRLLHLKGKRTVRVKEVPLTTASLNQGDVFILDSGLELYIFNGPSANVYEKSKAIEVAVAIDNDERHGKATIIRLDDDMMVGGFWGPLGGYVDPATLPMGEPDVSAPLAQQKVAARLYKIGSAASGTLDLAEVAQYPFSKDMLTSDMVCLLHSSSGKVFIWVGKQSPLDVKRSSMHIASTYIKQQGCGSASIERVGEGVETASFKSEFARWNPPLSFGLKAMKSGLTSVADPSIDVKQLMAQKAKEETPVDDGSGTVEVWKIKGFDKVALDKSLYGQFNGDDCYIVLYTYDKGGRRRYVIYFWLGHRASIEEKGTAALLTRDMDDAMGGTPVQVRVTQGKEPAHFRALFKGRTVVHFGEWSPALYHVSGSTEVNTMGTQVKPHYSSLNSEDAFVLASPSAAVVYVWVASGCIPEEATVATNIALVLASAGGREVATVAEGQEPEGFWNDLGGKGEYARTSPGEQHPKAARLFQASTATGAFRVEEVFDFEQTDLSEDDVFLTDVYTSLFVWVGAKSTEEEKKKSFDLAAKFVSEATDGRSPDTPVTRVVSGSEPPFFTAMFRTWDEQHAERSKFKDVYEDRLERLRAEKEKAAAPAPWWKPLRKVN